MNKFSSDIKLTYGGACYGQDFSGGERGGVLNVRALNMQGKPN